jgi:D-3-phosphoglycerate dehydrogenase / 2-oxoglutarate reductase
VRILVISPVHDDALSELEADFEVTRALNPDQDELAELVQDSEVLIMRSGVLVDAAVLARARHLQLIVRAGSGTDNIDTSAARERGVRVVTIPGPGAKAVSEMAFALMLSLARNVLEADRSLREGRWRKHEMTGRSLGGKTLGILGAGNIGSRVGRLGVAWGMTVLGTVESPDPAVLEKLEQQGIRGVPQEELLRRSDYLSVHVPLNDSTRGMLGADALACMQPTAFLINLSRGGVVDEHALYDALVEGRLAGAALDVHAQEGEGKISPLAALPNVVLTPHIGAGTLETQQEIGESILAFVREHAEARGSDIAEASA